MFKPWPGIVLQFTPSVKPALAQVTLFVPVLTGLDAYQRFNGQGNRVLRDNSFFDQFGASGGGPIWKNKVFAFFAWETVRSPKAQTNIANGWYETPAFAALAPSGSIAAKYLTFPGSGVGRCAVKKAFPCNSLVPLLEMT
jgi:hypothetical protein